nr:10487_t:CDS:10 [Entrophospora candida]
MEESINVEINFADLSWAEFLRTKALYSITSSNVTYRLEFLNHLLLPRIKVRDLSDKVIEVLLQLILLTYPRYTDRESRLSILNILKELNAWNSDIFLKTFVPMVVKEADKLNQKSSDGTTYTTASSSRFVLLTWINLMITLSSLSTNFIPDTSSYWKDLVNAQGLLLHTLTSEGEKRKGIRMSALRDVRRCIRKNSSHIPSYISYLTSSVKTCDPPFRNAVLLGNVIGCALRLQNKNKGILGKNLNEEIMQYYLSTIISSKISVPKTSADALHDFIKNVITEEDFNEKFVPVIEKLLLRAPEIVLNTLIYLLKSLSFDTSRIFKNHFIQPLLNHIRSTNKTVQTDAAELLNLLVQKSKNEDICIEIVMEIIQALSGAKVTNPEHRMILFQALNHIYQSPVVVKSLIKGLLPIVSKESNENSLAKVIDTLSLHAMSLFKHENDENTINIFTNATVEGLKSSKVGLRKSWALALGRLVWQENDIPSASFRILVKQSLVPLLSSMEKIQSNPLNYVGGPIEGYISIAIIEGRTVKWNDDEIANLVHSKKQIQNIFIANPKPSFWLWDKVYTKLTTFDEYQWFLRSIESVVINKSELLLQKADVRTLIANSFVYLITACQIYQIRREAQNTLRICNQYNPQVVGKIIREGLTQWLINLENGTKDSMAVLYSINSQTDHVINAYKFSTILTAITTFSNNTDKTLIEELLIELIILAHHPMIASQTDKYNWISLAQRAHLDPGKLVEKYSDHLLNIILEIFNTYDERTNFYKAALSAISTILFILKEQIIPLFLKQCKNNLDATLFDKIEEKDIDIWKTEEGTLFEIAKKKGSQTPKLTKDEQAAVNAQLKKESEIRNNVEQIRKKLVKGLDITDAMIDGSPETVEKYITKIMQLLFVVLKKSNNDLLGDKAVNTYLKLGLATSDQIEGIRRSIGLATLRAMDIKNIPDIWLQEPLEHLVTRVLYRLRFISERSVLPPSSFTYCFPLIKYIVIKGGLGCDINDENYNESVLEQITLGLDIISFHASVGTSTIIPRAEIIQVLLDIIKNYPKLAITAKKTLIDFCEFIGITASRIETSALFAGLLSSETFIRNACLQSLDFTDLTDIDFSCELWITCHDNDESNSKFAFKLWEENGMDIEENYAVELLPYLSNDVNYVRITAAKAIGEAAKDYPDTIGDTLSLIYDIYKKKAAPIKPEYDEYGILKPESIDRKDPWEARVGFALALVALAPILGPAEITDFFEFLIINEAVGDRHPEVRQKMLEAGLTAIDFHGSKNVTSLLTIFENYLDKPAEPTETHDRIRESVVIWFGALARHLDPTDSKIPMITDRLLETLKTPAESVQTAVADCLPPLIKTTKTRAPVIVEGLLNQLFHAEKYAARRGAAYGLAGVVKGIGISTLKDCNIMTTLKEAVDNKKDYKFRQGALFAFETLSQTLGRLFEPYVIQILPLLLTCFGDTRPDVREATSDTARIIMSKISGHCVKLILPSLLTGLEDRQWRTKKGSIELLGSMAFCAPKQLSISLPTIVPRLTEVLTDSHKNVQTAANEALLRFGEVISNPEIQLLVPILLGGLSDPDKKTSAALDALLETAFVHYIDAPSLALVMPILERGLKERSTEIKKKSSQIVGNMASLTDVKDLVPYLPKLLPGLKEVLVDPVPEARSTAAKALGTLVEKLGEDKFPDIVNELLHTLKSDTSGVDRQGSAQGLSEILSGLGLERLDGLLPEIINNTNSVKAYVREGFISLLIYLPATFGQRFQPYLGRIIPSVLSGLADESEYVRDASLKAGQMIVVNYATKAVDLLLPELERGLFDNNWRIRHSSVQLMGDLLYRITGISGKSDLEGDEEDISGGAEVNKKILLQVLGKERRDRVLAALYIVRQDVSGIVRQSSIHVWKAIVPNTPRTVKEILPVMMGIIIRNLASSSYERRQVAGRTLGELVRKVGESVLSEIIPILKDGLESNDPDMRQGVCIGLSEIMATAGKIQVIDYVDSIIPAVKKALIDKSGDVREAAAQAFDTLLQHAGEKAIDEILPSLLNSLKSGEDSEYALEALKEIMAIRANVVFPVLIPNLISVPISAFNARALASLVKVAGPALNKRLTNILSALMTSLGTETDEAIISELKETERALLLSIDETDGLQTLMMMLFESVKSDDPVKRSCSCDVLALFCNENKMDISRYIPEWIRVLILLLDDRQDDVVKSAWNALNSVTKNIKKDDLEQLVTTVRRAIKNVGVAGVDLPGFCLPKGIGPILPIFLHGLMYGTPEIREQSALSIDDLVQRTSNNALRPFITQITGPLIRVIGDRYPPQVKAAILQTLSSLLDKVPAQLKPFIPQLQRTFIKSLTDPSSVVVRSRAASALGILISLQTRVDPLVTELVTGAKTSDPSLKETMLSALENVVSKAGNGMSDASKKGVLEVIADGLNDKSDGVVTGAARLLASLCKYLTPSEALPVVTSLTSINAIIVESPMTFIDLKVVGAITDIIIAGTTINQLNVSNAAVKAMGKIMFSEKYHDEIVTEKFMNALINIISEPTASFSETKRLTLITLTIMGRRHPEPLEPHLITVIPLIVNCGHDKNVPVKLAAERALIYTLQLLDGDSMLHHMISILEPQASKHLVEYHKRVLTKAVLEEHERVDKINAGIITVPEDDDEQEIWIVGNSATYDFPNEN